MQRGQFSKRFFINIFLAVLAFLIGYGAYNMVSEALLLRHESRDIVQQIDDLTKKKKDLDAELRELESRQAMEREAKERLNLKLPGEQVVVVIPVPEANETSTAGETDRSRLWTSMIGRFLEWITP